MAMDAGSKKGKGGSKQIKLIFVGDSSNNKKHRLLFLNVHYGVGKAKMK